MQVRLSMLSLQSLSLYCYKHLIFEEMRMILKLSDAPLTNAESLYFVTLFKNRPYMGLFECIFNAESKYGNAN